MGGDGKSIFLGEYMAVLIVNGKCSENGLPLVPTQTNVLYLDWESNPETHRINITAIQAGLTWDTGSNPPETPQRIHYIQCHRPFREMLAFIRKFIADNNIGVVIIDSQMAATAENPQGMTEAAIASEYYNNLNTLNCTTLTIDHITKAGMVSGGSSATPYGSVVKFNRSRNQFEFKKSQEPDSNIMELAISHKKNNIGKLIKPFGVKVEFTENDNDELVRIDFSACDIRDNLELVRTLTHKQQVIAALKSMTTATFQEMADYTGIPYDSVKTTCYRHTKVFVKIDGNIWGLVTSNSNTYSLE